MDKSRPTSAHNRLESQKRQGAITHLKLRKIVMSIESLYHFFFESFAGVGILVLAGLVISVLVCVIMEWRTRQAFKDRGEVEDDDDDFTFFDDDDDEDE